MQKDEKGKKDSRKDRLKIFFSGIGGSGVSAIASFMAARGHEVSGSDRAFDLDPSHPVAKFLKGKNIRILPQDGSGIDVSLDLAVMSTAVEEGTPEVAKARSMGVLLKTRPQYLAELACGFKTVAVAGTSGKSTASGFLAFLMRELGLAPNFIGGGRVKAFKDAGKNPGNSIANTGAVTLGRPEWPQGEPEWLILEACESDGSIVNYRPFHSVILNLDVDHKGIEETAQMFTALAQNTRGNVIINADDANLRRLAIKGAVTFGINSSAWFMAAQIRPGPFGSRFTVDGVDFTINLPGIYNIYNALSAIAVLYTLGIPLGEIAGPMARFTGIDRRFDIHLNGPGEKLVIDDYAHNPHKIACFMQAVRAVRDRVCYVFQPHGFGPVRMMKKEYIEAFAQNLRKEDHLVLLPIFYQGGTVSMDVSSEDIARGVREAGKSSAVCGREDVLDMAGQWDCFAVMGARDESLSGFAAALAKVLIKKS